MSPSSPHPLLKAADIEASMQRKVHPLNHQAVRHTTSMSDKVGMQGLGIHKVRLDPETQSTVGSYRLLHCNIDRHAEWLYVLSGSGKLLLIDASLPTPPTSEPKQATDTGEKSEYEIEERDVGPGDFIGFRGGIGAAKFAHGLQSGHEGIEYLMGGTRERVDVCSYPQIGQTKVFEWDIPAASGVKSASAPGSQQ